MLSVMYVIVSSVCRWLTELDNEMLSTFSPFTAVPIWEENSLAEENLSIAVPEDTIYFLCNYFGVGWFWF